MTATASSAHTPRALSPLALVVALALAAGCSADRSPARAPTTAAGDPTRVEVWEAAEPAHAFVSTGALWARSLSKPQTIARLREEAARFYMDGIYAVECQGPLFGECRATGFVYEGNLGAPAPEVQAPTAKSTVASR